jgi:rRNA maturation RNase YbeY
LLTSLRLQDRDLSILLTNNEKIRRYNKELFGRDRPTNVISFSYADGFPCEVVGDLIVSVERAKEEAEAAGIPLYERLFALIIHGLLHVLGFDHEAGAAEARTMKYREKRLLAYVLSHRLYKEFPV